MTSLRPRSLAIALILALSGCVNLAPRYQAPDSAVPATWPVQAGAASPAGSVADIGWQTFFVDPRLQRVIALSLQNNRDLRIAMLDVQKARAQYRIQRASLLPAVDATASGASSRVPASVSGVGSATVTHAYTAELGLSSYEIDVFGRLTNLKDAALESYLAQAQTQRSTQISLVAEVASDWLTLASDMALLRLAEQTHESQQKTYDLVLAKYQVGASSGLDLAQAKGDVEAARKDVASYTTVVAQDRNALTLVVGGSVADADLPGADIETPVTMAAVPVDLPSRVLLQRPDVLSAEHTLKADYANIGAARAAFFPSITLTAAKGVQSDQLSHLFSGGNNAWSFAPSINLPIFDAGSNRATLDSAKVDRDIAVATYQKTIQTAFQEVADALATRATIDDQLDAQSAAVAANQKAYDLSMAKYRLGSLSLIDALTTQRTLYDSQQTMVSVRLSAQTSLISLYKAMGGGASASVE